LRHDAFWRGAAEPLLISIAALNDVKRTAA
jgi:hypothetical protein